MSARHRLRSGVTAKAGGSWEGTGLGGCEMLRTGFGRFSRICERGDGGMLDVFRRFPGRFVR